MIDRIILPLIFIVCFSGAFLCAKALFVCIDYEQTDLIYIVCFYFLMNFFSGWKLLDLFYKLIRISRWKFWTTRKRSLAIMLLIITFTWPVIYAQSAIDEVARRNLTVGQSKDRARDYQAALYFYKRAAALGNPQAQYNLASMLRTGLGVERDPDVALRWLKKAAAQYDPSALADIGTMYYRGDGVPMDRKKGLQYLEKAARLGNQIAKRNLMMIEQEK
jgi:hypothetical protein